MIWGKTVEDSSLTLDMQHLVVTNLEFLPKFLSVAMSSSQVKQIDKKCVSDSTISISCLLLLFALGVDWQWRNVLTIVGSTFITWWSRHAREQSLQPIGWNSSWTNTSHIVAEIQILPSVSSECTDPWQRHLMTFQMRRKSTSQTGDFHTLEIR